jgi:hypothetical protein
MKTVKILATEKNGQKPICHIILDGGRLRAEPPDAPAGRNILGRPLFDPKTRKKISAEDDPERFLELLQVNYTGSYVRATAPQ